MLMASVDSESLLLVYKDYPNGLKYYMLLL